jgi:hypothetical protein
MNSAESLSKIEGNIKSLLLNHFPQYFAFRNEYIIPLTYNKRPHKLDYRPDTHPNLEEISMASKMVGEDLNSLLSILNDLWKAFELELKLIYEHPNFGSLFRNYKRNIE